jgi:hypothetical protein
MGKNIGADALDFSSKKKGPCRVGMGLTAKIGSVFFR